MPVVVGVVKGRGLARGSPVDGDIVQRGRPDKIRGEAGHDSRPSPQIARGDRAVRCRSADGVSLGDYVLNDMADDEIVNGGFVCQLYDTRRRIWGPWKRGPGDDMPSPGRLTIDPRASALRGKQRYTPCMGTGLFSGALPWPATNYLGKIMTRR